MTCIGIFLAFDDTLGRVKFSDVKKFTVPCQFGSQTAPFTIYIGSPKRDTHPIYNQAAWLSKERGGVVPQKVMDSLAKLRELAEENNVSFEDLCVYALKVAEQEEGQDQGEESSPEE